jgi:serine/threonine protein kinase
MDSSNRPRKLAKRSTSSAVTGELGNAPFQVPFLYHALPNHCAAADISARVLSFLPEWITETTIRNFQVMPQKYQTLTLDNLRQLDFEEAQVDQLVKEGGTYEEYKVRGKVSGHFFRARYFKQTKDFDGCFNERFLREVAALKACKHPNILSLLNIFETPSQNRKYLALEWCDTDLDAVLNEEGYTVNTGVVKNYMFQLLQGISYLHACGLVHRNLRCKNIFINHAGRLKISNLNFSRTIMTEIDVDHGLTATTPEYGHAIVAFRPPETLLGARQYSFPVDMWAAGRIFWELAGGHEYTEGSDNEMDVLIKVYKLLGTPNESTWPGVSTLPHFHASSDLVQHPRSINENHVGSLGPRGFDLMTSLFAYPPERIPCDVALRHPYFDHVDESLKSMYSTPLTGSPKRFTSIKASRKVVVDDYFCKMYQKDLKPRMRAILLDWLVDVADEYHMSDQAFYLSVQFVDRCLGKFPVARKELQLLGCACIMIAAKMESTHSPRVPDFVYISDNTFTADELRSMEEKVLMTGLDYDLIYSTPVDFLAEYLQAGSPEDTLDASFYTTWNIPKDATVQEIARYLSMYICELGIQSTVLSTILGEPITSGSRSYRSNPSKLAAAAIVLARRTLGFKEVWTQAHERCSGYTLRDLMPCEKVLKRCHYVAEHQASETVPLTASKQKYGNVWAKNVSSIGALPENELVAFESELVNTLMDAKRQADNAMRQAEVESIAGKAIDDVVDIIRNIILVRQDQTGSTSDSIKKVLKASKDEYPSINEALKKGVQSGIFTRSKKGRRYKLSKRGRCQCLRAGEGEAALKSSAATVVANKLLSP